MEAPAPSMPLSRRLTGPEPYNRVTAMMTLLLSLLLAPQGVDTVITRDNKKVEGRILEYPGFIDVEPLEGKKVRILRADILRIDSSTVPVRCPELAPFPPNLLEQGRHTFLSFGHVLVSLPDASGRKVTALDFNTGTKIWQIDLPARVGKPILGGRTLHFMERDKFLDDKLKYKIAGNSFTKEIHKLQVTAVDLETGQTTWTQIYDNNDRKDLLWEFIGGSVAPELDILPDRILIRAKKSGFPIDKKGEVDKRLQAPFTTTYHYDPEARKHVSATDMPDNLSVRSRPYYLQDLVVTLVASGQGMLRFTALGARDGKPKWQSDEFIGRLFDVVGDQAYVIGTSHIDAWSIRTGKKIANWSVEHLAGTVTAVDFNNLYIYRTEKEPRAILGYDVKTSKEAFRILMPERDGLTHLMLAGHRLLYYDRANTLYCYDTIQKKDLWKWTGAGAGLIISPALAGAGLTLLKDGRVTCLDILTGEKVWEHKGLYSTITTVGNVGILAHHMQIGWDIIRERKSPKGSTFLTKTHTPLRFAMGEDEWSVPAFADGKCWVLSANGLLLAIDLKDKKILSSPRLVNQRINKLSPPVFWDGRLAVNINGQSQVFDPEGRKQQYQMVNSLVQPHHQFHLAKGEPVTGHESGLARWDPATGKRLWDSKAAGIKTFVIQGGNAVVLTNQNVQVVDLGGGETQATMRTPYDATRVAADGARVFVTVGPYEAGEASAEEEFRPLFKSISREPEIRGKFAGELAAGGGILFFSHADGEVTGINEKDGKSLWAFKTPQFTSFLLLHKDRLWFSAPGVGLVGLDARTGDVAWKAEVSDPARFVPFLTGDRVAFWSSEGWMIETGEPAVPK